MDGRGTRWSDGWRVEVRDGVMMNGWMEEVRDVVMDG